MINLPLSRIEDIAVRTSFEQIAGAINGSPLNEFKLYEVETSGAVTNKELYHNLGYIPLDVIVTNITSGTVTFEYASFTKDKLVFNTSGATRIRFLLGTVSK
jgi:hypothetical protein